MKRLPILLSVPHGGTKVPDMLAERINLSPLELLIDSDTRTLDVFSFQDEVQGYVDTDIARCVVDVNRDATTDEKSVFRALSWNGKHIWKQNVAPNVLEREALLERYYHPYHARLAHMLDNIDVALAVDAHAMVPRKRKTRRTRPLFCISNRGSSDPNHPREHITAPFSLMKRLKRNLEATFSDLLLFDVEEVVRINDPFRGGFITAYHGSHPRIPFVQIEVNRALYLPSEQGIRLDQTQRERMRIRIIRDKLLQVLERTVWDETRRF